MTNQCDERLRHVGTEPKFANEKHVKYQLAGLLDVYAIRVPSKGFVIEPGSCESEIDYSHSSCLRINELPRANRESGGKWVSD